MSKSKRINMILVGIVCLLSTGALGAETRSTLYTNGRFLYSPCGEKIVLRGINAELVYADRDGLPTYAQIAKTGANCVRIMWKSEISPLEMEPALANAIAYGLIPIVGLWDATGLWDADLDKCVNFWKSPEAVKLVAKYQDKMIVNIANEAGGNDPSDYRQKYSTIVQALRTAGIHAALMIDASTWGRSESVLFDHGSSILQADPEGNVMFAWHPWNSGYDVRPVLTRAKDAAFCFLVGEFAHKSVGCIGTVDYKTIMDVCTQYELGYIAWSWGVVPNSDCLEFDMTSDQTFRGLQTWGLEVAVTDPNSIKNTSHRPAYMLQGYCDGAPTATITSPVSGASISVGETVVNITAQPSTGATITKVELLNDDSLLGQVTASPYQFRPVLAAGIYRLRAKVTDSQNRFRSSELVIVKAGRPYINVAAGKRATASSTETGYFSENAIDGSKATRWSSAKNDSEWLKIDLGKSYAVDKIVLTWEAAYSQSYTISVSTDNQVWSDQFSTTSGNGGEDQVSFASVNAGYVKLLLKKRATQYGNSLFEVEVFGYDDAPLDILPPSIPAGITTNNVRYNGATVTWQPATDPQGIKGYNLYIDGVPWNDNAIEAPTFDIRGLQPLSTYAIQVMAVDWAGNKSALSSTASFTTSPEDPLARHRYLKLKVEQAIEGATVELSDIQWRAGKFQFWQYGAFWSAACPAEIVFDLNTHYGPNAQFEPTSIVLKTSWSEKLAPKTFTCWGSDDAQTWTELPVIKRDGVAGGSSGLTVNDWAGTADAFTEFIFAPYGSGSATTVQQGPRARDTKFLISARSLTRGHIRIDINSSTASLARISMIDSRGRLVARTESILHTGFNSVKLSSASIAKGVYICRVEYKNGERWVRQDIRLSVVER